MRLWWWLLITTNLVSGDLQTYDNLYDDEDVSFDKSEDGPHKEFQTSSNYSPETIFTRRRRSLTEEEREKRQPRFHSWGGKRFEYQEDNDDGGNETDQGENYYELTHQKDLFYTPSYLPLNLSNHQLDTIEDNSLGIYNKRAKHPAFSSWGGKRDPEIMNEQVKKSSFYNTVLQPDALQMATYEKNRKRYPAFNSWAGKRAAAFNSWGGKRAAAFNSWGGKRAPAFNSWGGKRAPAFNSWGGKRAPAFNSWGGKRAPAFNSWGGKRAPAFNSWGGKRAPAFNSWGGKRDAAFNSWGGKRAPAFTSWGGKRAAAFNSWGGKRAPAFNSWGGKRAPAFNSWGGKRAPAFNSWGGKRAAAFNSWGGKKSEGFKNIGLESDISENLDHDKLVSDNNYDNSQFNILEPEVEVYSNEDSERDEPVEKRAFSSWGGKRDILPDSSLVKTLNYLEAKRKPAFNSWGGKRADLVSDSYRKSNNDGFQITNNPFRTDASTNGDFFLRVIPLAESKEQDLKAPKITKDILSQAAEKEFYGQKYDDKNLVNDKNYFTDQNEDNADIFKNSGMIQQMKRDKASYFKLQPRYPGFSSWAGKRSPFFSTWYETRDKNKVPIIQLSNGKRMPAFSSWGGKRSENSKSVQKDAEDCSPPEGNGCGKAIETSLYESEQDEHFQLPNENNMSRKKRETNCNNEENKVSGMVHEETLLRNKRSDGNVKKNKIITKMLLQGGINWPMTMQSFSKGINFYAWGGKRAL